MQKFRQLLRRRIPARAPVAVHAQAEANRINFLSHKFICSISCLPFSLAAFSRPSRFRACRQLRLLSFSRPYVSLFFLPFSFCLFLSLFFLFALFRSIFFAFISVSRS